MKNIIKASIVTLSVMASSYSLANEISVDFLKNEIQVAHKQYLTGSPESGLYALEALSRLLVTEQSKVGPNDLSFTYLRIGLLHEKSGNEPKASLYFSKAVDSYKGSNIQITQLKEAVAHLDGHRS